MIQLALSICGLFLLQGPTDASKHGTFVKQLASITGSPVAGFAMLVEPCPLKGVVALDEHPLALSMAGRMGGHALFRVAMLGQSAQSIVESLASVRFEDDPRASSKRGPRSFISPSVQGAIADARFDVFVQFKAESAEAADRLFATKIKPMLESQLGLRAVRRSRLADALVLERIIGRNPFGAAPGIPPVETLRALLSDELGALPSLLEIALLSLVESSRDSSVSPPSFISVRLHANERLWCMPRTSVTELAKTLEEHLDLSVLNETGIGGDFSFALNVGSGSLEDVSRALDRCLGLRLARERRKFDVLVIEPTSIAAGMRVPGKASG